MSITLIVGGLLVIFGLLVLLKFPDRPGGKVAFGKFEVSSTGAGLPLVALGVVCLLVGARDPSGGFWPFAVGPPPTPTASPSPTPTPSASPTPGTQVDCPPAAGGETDASAAAAEVEAGTRELRVRPRADTSPSALRLSLTDNGRFAGLVALTLHSPYANTFFKVGAVFDANCREVTDYENVSHPGSDPAVLQNWGTLRLPLNGATYELRVGYTGRTFEVKHFTKN